MIQLPAENRHTVSRCTSCDMCVFDAVTNPVRLLCITIVKCLIAHLIALEAFVVRRFYNHKCKLIFGST